MSESFTVRTPVDGYTGVAAGVVFDAGAAVVDASNTSALRYFRKAGYSVTPTPTASPAPVAEEAAPAPVAPVVKKAPAKKAPARKAAARKKR